MTPSSERSDFEVIVEQVVQEVIRKLGEDRRLTGGESECAVCVLMISVAV